MRALLAIIAFVFVASSASAQGPGLPGGGGRARVPPDGICASNRESERRVIRFRFRRRFKT